MKYFILILSILLIALCCSSCVAITTHGEDGSVIKHYFGYVRIKEPAKVGNPDFKVREIQTVGLRVENGFGVGYFKEREEFIPLDGRLVIRVKNTGQLKWIKDNILPFIKEKDLCTTVDPSQ